MTNEEKVEQFNAKYPTVAIAYGGDGTLLETIAANPIKNIIPIRNYGLCEKHKDVLDLALKRPPSNLLNFSKHNFIQWEYAGKSAKGIAEITIKSLDPTSAIRFNVSVNDQTYLQNGIADGIIYASDMGSHGYWKSITRTIFRGDDNVGLGFIAPTYGINNLILKTTDKVEIEFERDCAISLTTDKQNTSFAVCSKSKISLSQLKCCAIMYGYDIFCCYECRKNRNSTILNDMYFV